MEKSASSDLRGGRGNVAPVGQARHFGQDEEENEDEEQLSVSKALLDCLKGCPAGYLNRVAKCPLCIFLLMQVFVGILCGAMFNGWAVNTDFEDFLQASTETSVQYDAVQQAWAVPEARRLQEITWSWRHTGVTVAYYKESGNVLEEENLLAIRNFEHWLQASAAWQEACGLAVTSQDAALTTATQQYSCSPGESLVNYVWPTFDNGNGTGLDGISVGSGEKQQLYLDGAGLRRFPVEAVIASFRDVPMKHDRLQRFFPKDFVPPEGGENAQSNTLRSFFLFSQSVGTDGYFSSNAAALAAREKFFGGDLHGLLNTYQKDLQELGIRVFYTSAQLDEADIFSALFSDVLLSLIGLAVIFLLVCVHTGSLCLACAGSLLVLECMPLGYVFYRQFSGLPKMSIVNCVATFVIIGIGSDMIFVLTDAWRQSAFILPHSNQEEVRKDGEEEEELDRFERAMRSYERNLEKRLAWVYRNAGVSCLTTGLCGASSFLVNLMSVLMPLREFGLFMGLCCIFAVLGEIVMYPMALVARERWKFKKVLAQQERELEGNSAMTGVVVPAQAHVVPIEAADNRADKSKTRSILVRFFAGFWPEFIMNYKLWVIAGFVVLALASVVGVPLGLKVDGSTPVIFPSSHNQVLGEEILKGFEVVDPLAATAALEQAYICDAAASPLAMNNDMIVGCGTFVSLNYCSNSFEGTMRSQCSTACGFRSYCLASWCPVDAAPNVSKPEPGRCDCYQDNSAEVFEAPNSSSIVRFETLVVGFQQENWTALEPYLRQIFTQMIGTTSSGMERFYSYKGRLADGDAWSTTVSVIGASRRPPIVQQHWRSGTLATWRSFQAPVFSVKMVPTGSTVADDTLPETVVSQQCFCDGIQPCNTWAAQMQTVSHSLETLSGSGTTRRLDRGKEVPIEAAGSDLDLPNVLGQDMGLAPVPRRLQVAVPSTRVEVVWGLEVRQLGPFDLFVQSETDQLWSLDSSFDPADPWVQRSIMQVPESAPEDLRVISTSTFIQAFEQWLVGQGLEFPARHFHSSAKSFLEASGNAFPVSVLRDENDIVKALKLEFRIALTSANDLSTTIAVKTAWEHYIQQQNDLSGLGANKAFQVSSLWINVEAQDGIIRSTVTTITSAIFIGYLAAVIFTQDLVLSLFPMLSVGLTVLCLLFMMVGVLQWPFGPVDVISLIVFLGYMFTFNLHVAQYYNHAEVALDLDEDGTIDPADEAERKQEERYCRVNHALASVGQSLIFSAGTTTASAIFLLCCVLQFFVKFGAVILSVTVLSILHSLIFLPALLLICGPTSKSCMCLKKVCRKLRQKVAPAEAVEPEPAQGETEECMSPPPLPPPAVRPDAEPVGGTEPASPLNSYIRQMDSHEEEV